MKNLLSLMVLLVVLFNFWSCVNQDDEILDEQLKTEFIENKNLEITSGSPIKEIIPCGAKFHINIRLYVRYDG